MSSHPLDRAKDNHTGKEIFSQPKVWEVVYDLIAEQEKEISKFLDPIFDISGLQIILTGAGSSAFIGEAAYGLFHKVSGKIVQSIPTTNIVTHPSLFFTANLPTLLVSFARSGSSPESLETIFLADTHCQEVYHLVITCNKKGELSKYMIDSHSRAYVLVLPESTHDKSLAMTCSFTSMLLSALLVVDIHNIKGNLKFVRQIIAQGNEILNKHSVIKELALKKYERVVFLGSGEMLGISRECHLKLLELTDGNVVCNYDSFLGFRHGPRAFINEKTLMVYLFSMDRHVSKYEQDLVKEIAKDPRNIMTLSLGHYRNDGEGNNVHITLEAHSENPYLMVSATILGQLLGYYNSIFLGLNPDSPSSLGTISRVVSGVNLYKFTKKK